MASTARIDELKKKFDENPRRYFAPLANEFRKTGDAEQAGRFDEQETTNERDEEDPHHDLGGAPHGLEHEAGLLRSSGKTGGES